MLLRLAARGVVRHAAVRCRPALLSSLVQPEPRGSLSTTATHHRVTEEDALAILQQEEAGSESLAQLLERLRDNRQYDLVWKVYRKLRDADGSQNGTALTPRAYTTFLQVLSEPSSRPHLTQRALVVEEDMRKADMYDESDEEQAAALIRTRAHGGDFEAALGIFERARAAAAKGGRPLPTEMVLTFLGACAYARKAERALELHEELMVPSGATVRDKGVSLAFVLRAFARRGEVDAVAQQLETAVAAGNPVHTAHMNALLRAYMYAGRPAEAIDLFHTRPPVIDALPADQETYMLLLRAAVDSGEMSVAMQMREDALSAGVWRTGWQGNDVLLIRALLDVERYSTAFRLYDQCRAAHGPPTSLRMSALLVRACYSAAGEADETEDRARWMDRAIDIYLDGQRLVTQRQALPLESAADSTRVPKSAPLEMHAEAARLETTAADLEAVWQRAQQGRRARSEQQSAGSHRGGGVGNDGGGGGRGGSDRRGHGLLEQRGGSTRQQRQRDPVG